MRILLVTQNFYPENFKGNDIAFDLAKRGHRVEVLTAIPNYPQGRFYKGYGFFSRRKEIVDGVIIRRVLTIPRRHNKICLILNYLVFWLLGSFRAFFLGLTHRYDRVLVQQLSPITQAYPGIIVSRMQHIPLYMWVLDIWPDSMVSGGGIRNPFVIKMMNRIVTQIYNHCTKILISSEGFRQLVRDDPRVKWIFVGDGSKKNWLEEFVKKHKLENTVFILGRYPFSTMPAFFACADVMLLSLKVDFPHLKAVVPARLQSYMSAARPILAMTDGGAAQIIREADCGYVVPSGDSEALVRLIRNKILTDLESLAIKGQNGRRYFERYFMKEHCMNNLEKIIA